MDVFVIRNPIEGAGRIYWNNFFVQSILTDWYINRREMGVVALESTSSVEFEMKTIFWYLFYSRSYRGLEFCVNTVYSTKLCSLLTLFKLKFIL